MSNFNAMNYLIYYKGESFYTNWFDIDNNYVEGMIVFDLRRHTCYDGEGLIEIKQDHL